MRTLKATGKSDASLSILVSFQSHWLEPLIENKISVVFRKRGPMHFIPDSIYIYVTNPVGAVIGRATINQYERLPVYQALKLADKGLITREELGFYAGVYGKLAVYKIGNIAISNPFVKRDTLKEQFDFFPPQSFMILSKEGRDRLDQLLNLMSSNVRSPS